MQTEGSIAREDLFTADYPYFSSYSDSWLAHAQMFVDRMVQQLDLGPEDLVVEIASNDGYLLQFVLSHSVQALGIEPTAATASAARERGVTTIEGFFGRRLGRELASEGQRPSLMVANNVLAHVPDINDFVAGFAELLAPDGLATFEFPHLFVLLRDGLYDTIYHEHYSYLSLGTVQRIFERNGLRVIDVEEIPTHGGSLRVHAVHNSNDRVIAAAVGKVLEKESRTGLFTPAGYGHLQDLADRTRAWLNRFLEDERVAGRTVMAYGAAAKGTTLLNHAQIGPGLICGVVDRNPAKQGKQIPGTGIPIHPEHVLVEVRPDTILILPWNLRNEIAKQLSYTREWGARLVVPLPEGHVW